MYDMLSSNLRGGMSFASQRYAESAVFQDMQGVPRVLDEAGRHTVILDIDANNLYGCSQTFPLPFADFQFLKEEDYSGINWLTIDLEGEIGYFLEVTLFYPENIWEKTKSFPLCPQNIEIKYEMLSPYQKEVLKDIYAKKNYKSRKLTATFNRREKIVLHAKNLQLFLKLGMVLEKVFRVIRFRQAPYMKSWVDFCTKKCSQAKNEFEKNFFKLLINSNFGKSIEGIENRKKIKICTDVFSFTKAVRSPSYERHIIVNESISIVVLANTKAKVIRPYYIGFSILELSKNVMYDFFYSVLRPFFGENGIQLLYSDTDSLAIEVKTFDIITDLQKLGENMDFSNLDKNHVLFSNANKAQLFKFKEEFALQPIARLCALKSKCYSFEIACTHTCGINSKGVCLKCGNKKYSPFNVNKLKGIQKKTARDLHFKKYLKCLEENHARRDKVYQITSKAQSISTNLVNKISLSSFDDKSYILNCGVHSEPFSHVNNPFCKICEI